MKVENCNSFWIWWENNRPQPRDSSRDLFIKLIPCSSWMLPRTFWKGHIFTIPKDPKDLSIDSICSYLASRWNLILLMLLFPRCLSNTCSTYVWFLSTTCCWSPCVSLILVRRGQVWYFFPDICGSTLGNVLINIPLTSFVVLRKLVRSSSGNLKYPEFSKDPAWTTFSHIQYLFERIITYGTALEKSHKERVRYKFNT